MKAQKKKKKKSGARHLATEHLYILLLMCLQSFKTTCLHIYVNPGGQKLQSSIGYFLNAPTLNVMHRIFHLYIVNQIKAHTVTLFPNVWCKGKNQPPQNISLASGFFQTKKNQSPKHSGRNFDLPPICLKNIYRRTLPGRELSPEVPII